MLTFNEPVTIGTTNLNSVFVIKDSQGNPLNLSITIPSGFGTLSGGSWINVTEVVITFLSSGSDTFNFGSARTVGSTSTPGGAQSLTVGLSDGNYYLNTNGALISNNGVLLDYNHNGSPGAGGTEVDEFWRLFGDSRGVRAVDGSSAGDFKNANNQPATTGSKGTANPLYEWYFDYNEDGNVDVNNTIDQAAFLARVYTNLGA